MSASEKLPAPITSENVNVNAEVPSSFNAVATMSTVIVGSTASTSTVSLAPTAFGLPAASVNVPAATLTDAVPSKSAAGVKVAVQTSGSSVCVRPVTVPPTATMSASVKLPAPITSENVNVTAEVPSSFNAVATMSTVIVGSTASTSTVSLAPTAFGLPAASVNVPAATLTDAVPSKSAAGVKVAVQTSGSSVCVRPVTVPPTATMSASVKLPAPITSENVNVTAEVPSSFNAFATMSRSIVGSTASTSTVSLAPTAFGLPAASVNVPAATLTDAVP